MESRIYGIGEYVARLPFFVGHELSDDHVVIGAFDPTSRTIVHGAIEWESAVPDAQFAQSLVDHMAKALRQESVARMVVVCHGPDGPGRAALVAEHIAETMAVTTTVLHVDGGTWRQQIPDGWTPPCRVPDGIVDMVAQGRPAPAASRQELVESVAPLANPLFDVAGPDLSRKLAALSPFERLNVAVGTLEALASSRTDDPRRMQILAHAVTSDPVVRESVMAHTVADSIRDADLDALVRTFRAAPPSLRPELAATAAATAFLAAWPPPLVSGLLKHTDPSDELGRLVTRALESGVKPHPLRSRLAEAARDGINGAQRTWAAAHPDEPEAGATPGSPRAARTQPSPPPAASRPAAPAAPEGPGL